MRKECAGCGAILPDDVLACPICGGEEFVVAAEVAQPPKTARAQVAMTAAKQRATEERPEPAKAPEPQDKPASKSEVDPAKQGAMEQFFMETITQLILGEAKSEAQATEAAIAMETSLLEQKEPEAKLVIHEVILFKGDKTELVRKKYGPDGCSGIEIMRIRDFLGSSEYVQGKFQFIDPEHSYAAYGSSYLIFAMKISGRLHPQAEFVVKKVAEVGDTRLSTQSADASIEHLRHMMEKLCDALHSALVKLSG